MDALRSKVNKLELENDNLSRDKRGLVEDNQKLKQKCQRMNRCVERHDITVAECREKQTRMKDQLDFAPALRDDSRLACQCVPDGSVDVEVEIPDWNRNEVSEEPH